jgi:lysozyme family protein
MTDDVTAFETAVYDVLGEEGGYVNDPADPGAETKWGFLRERFLQ